MDVIAASGASAQPCRKAAQPLRRGIAALLVVTAACAAPDAAEEPPTEGDAAPSAASPPTAAPNTLTDAEKADGWRLLFDGETLDGWRPFKGKGAPAGWAVEDGTLARVGPGGDIVTDERFEDFELSLEWRIAPGGNSGIFYLVSEDADYVWEAAPEMQVLDDAGHADGESELTSAGSNFALHPAPRGVVRPAGEWNEARIVVRDGHVEHWLNGRQIVEYDLGSDDWQRRVAASKFAEWERYGQTRAGPIGLQDHGDPVWFRSIKIRDLGAS
ncbi:MAG TPA: DUF1080 domain-containing protein [Longimicrobiales bacterium]|nr:DUF1080 domain-containing protein [Longimicrobiales bacterium]